MKKRPPTRSCRGWRKAGSIRGRLTLHTVPKTRSRSAPPVVRERAAGRSLSVGAMVLIQLLLPTSGAVNADGLAPLAETRRELAERFNGLTAYLRSPAKGWWTAPDGHAQQDDVVMVEVVTDTFDRPWWRAYAITLAARFGQESIHLRAVPVDLLDEDNR